MSIWVVLAIIFGAWTIGIISGISIGMCHAAEILKENRQEAE